MSATLTPNQVEKQYPNQWVVLEVLEGDRLGRTKKARLIGTSADRDEAQKMLINKRKKFLELRYTGKIPKDLAVILSSHG